MLFFVMTYWKNLQLLGATPPDPYQRLCPWTPLGVYCGPQTPASFSSFFTFPQSHVWSCSWLLWIAVSRSWAKGISPPADVALRRSARGTLSSRSLVDALVDGAFLSLYTWCCCFFLSVHFCSLMRASSLSPSGSSSSAHTHLHCCQMDQNHSDCQ